QIIQLPLRRRLTPHARGLLDRQSTGSPARRLARLQAVAVDSPPTRKRMRAPHGDMHLTAVGGRVRQGSAQHGESRLVAQELVRGEGGGKPLGVLTQESRESLHPLRGRECRSILL